VIEVMEQRGMRTMGTVIRFELPGIQLSSEKRSQRMANSSDAAVFIGSISAIARLTKQFHVNRFTITAELRSLDMMSSG